MSFQATNALSDVSYQVRAACIASKKSGSTRTPNAHIEWAVAVELANQYRDKKGYADSTLQQIAAAVGLSQPQVKRAAKVLHDAEIWIVVKAGNKHAGAAHRAPGQLLTDAMRCRATGSELPDASQKSRDGLGVSLDSSMSRDGLRVSPDSPKSRDDLQGSRDDLHESRDDLGGVKGRAKGVRSPSPYLHTSIDHVPELSDNSEPQNKKRDGLEKKENRGSQHKQVSDIFEQAAKLAAETRASNGWSQLGSKKMAQNAEQARSEWNVDANRWLELGASTSSVISALAERINDNTAATPRDLDRDYSDHGPSCGCRECKPDLHPTGCDCIDCAAAGLEHVAALDDSTPTAPPEHIRALLAQGIGQRTTTESD